MGILLFELSILESNLYYIFLFLYGCYLLQRFGIRVIAVCFSIILLILLFYSIESGETLNNVSGYVMKVSESSIVVKNSQYKALINYNNEEIMVGDYIEVDFEERNMPVATNFNGFDYGNYLYGSNIKHYGNGVKILAHTKNNSIKSLINRRINNIENDQVRSYTKLLLLGVKEDNTSDLYESLQELNISHLIVLSGMHIQFFYTVFLTLFKAVLNEKKSNIIAFSLLFTYVFLILDYQVSAIRAFIILLISKFGPKNCNKLDVISIIGIVMILHNSYIIYNYSFILSFYFYICVLFTKNMKYNAVLMFVLSIPVLLAINYSFNIISIVLNMIISPYIFLLIILAILCLIFPQISFIYVYCIDNFENMIAFCNSLDFTLFFSKLANNELIIILIIVVILLQRIEISYKRFQIALILLSFLFTFYFKPVLSPFGQVTMIDVGQGDCILIKQPFSDGGVLIDTGGNINYDLATKTIIPYLQSIGVRYLDAVFITHHDNDHDGALESLQNNYTIKKIIDYKFDYLKIGDIEFFSLENDKSFDNSNNESLIIYATINKLNYLFTGDIEEKVEIEIINDYPTLLVDILKVAHHGSNTSSTSRFISHILPQIALISVSKNNIYHLPSNAVLERLNAFGVNTYLTSIHGMIRIRYNAVASYIDYALE